jgi:hypothetical protein
MLGEVSVNAAEVISLVSIQILVPIDSLPSVLVINFFAVQIAIVVNMEAFDTTIPVQRLPLRKQLLPPGAILNMKIL